MNQNMNANMNNMGMMGQWPMMGPMMGDPSMMMGPMGYGPMGFMGPMGPMGPMDHRPKELITTKHLTLYPPPPRKYAQSLEIMNSIHLVLCMFVYLECFMKYQRDKVLMSVLLIVKAVTYI